MAKEIYLAAWRKRAGLTQSVLAERVGATDKTKINKLEKGKHRLTHEWRAKIAPHVGALSPDDLMAPPGDGTLTDTAENSPPGDKPKEEEMEAWRLVIRGLLKAMPFDVLMVEVTKANEELKARPYLARRAS